MAASPIQQPQVMVISALGHDETIQDAIRLGASYYLIKPFDAEVLGQRIVDMVNKRAQNNLATKAIAGSSTKSIDEQITNIFLITGIPAHIKGYHFLRYGVKLVMEDQRMINSITKQLYPTIAQHFETSSSKVERAIRHAIDVAWTRGKIECINQIFGYTVYTKNDKPTNGEFIALVADKLLMDQKSAS